MESTDNPTGEPMNSRVFGVSDAGQAYLKVSFFILIYFFIFLFRCLKSHKNVDVNVNKIKFITKTKNITPSKVVRDSINLVV